MFRPNTSNAQQTKKKSGGQGSKGYTAVFKQAMF